MRFRTSVARRAVGWWAELPVASDHDESPIQLNWLWLGAVAATASHADLTVPPAATPSTNRNQLA